MVVVYNDVCGIVDGVVSGGAQIAVADGHVVGVVSGGVALALVCARSVSVVLVAVMVRASRVPIRWWLALVTVVVGAAMSSVTSMWRWW